jgi:hypothetical protein
MRMTPRAIWTLAYLLWAVGLVPAVLVAMWLGAVDWSWRGFAIGYVVLAAISLGFETFVRFIERWLAHRRERDGAASSSEH